MSLGEFVRLARSQRLKVEDTAEGLEERVMNRLRRESREAPERFAWGLVSAYGAVALGAMIVAKAMSGVAAVMTYAHLVSAMQSGLSLY
jgi:translation initiation factor 2 alpha subunit (eIF-2alpha)